MAARWWRTSVITALLMCALLGAGSAAPSCNASCIVTPQTNRWTCSCRWSAPFGLSRTRSTFAVPPGMSLRNPDKQAATGTKTTDLIEVRGGQFEIHGDQISFRAIDTFQPGKAYVIPYVLDDGSQRQEGVWHVSQINIASP